jgi:hypothetical protein
MAPAAKRSRDRRAWGGLLTDGSADRVDEGGDLAQCRRVALEVREVRDPVEQSELSPWGDPGRGQDVSR